MAEYIFLKYSRQNNEWNIFAVDVTSQSQIFKMFENSKYNITQKISLYLISWNVYLMLQQFLYELKPSHK